MSASNRERAPAAGERHEIAAAFRQSIYEGERDAIVARLADESPRSIDAGTIVPAVETLGSLDGGWAEVGPLRTTYGDEYAFASAREAGGDIARVDVIRLDRHHLVADWQTILNAELASADRTRDALGDYVTRVGRGDASATLELFGETCWVEDPVGTPVHNGRDAVEAFYRNGLSTITATTLLGAPVAPHGRIGAVAFSVSLTMKERPLTLDVIDVMRFAEDGQIESMRAFWGRENRR